MLRIALTGGIATGKSFCLGVFASLGVPTIDADLLFDDRFTTQIEEAATAADTEAVVRTSY